MMRFAVVLLALAAALPAAAQLREGVYGLSGRTPEGETYDGAVALRGGPGGSWLMQWQVGGARILGLGLVHGGILSVAFQVNGNPGIAAYEVDKAGTLQGVWTTGAGLGSEVLTPQDRPTRNP